MKKYKVAILGATGAVGREMMKVLAERDFPIEELHPLASARSVGQAIHWKGHDLPVEMACDEAFKGMDIVLGAAENDIAKQFAPAIVKAGAVFVDNSSAFRMDPDVPLIVPEINPEHFKVIEFQKKRLGTTRGFVAVKPNCSIQSYAPVLTAWKEFEPYEVVATTYQAISGAGKTFKDWPEMEGNIIPYIGGEEEKSEKEPLRICGLSLGALLAIDFAIRHEEKVASLVLIGAQYKVPSLLIDFQNLIFRCMPDKAFESMGLSKSSTIKLAHSMRSLDFTSQLNNILCPVTILCGKKDTANLKASKRLKELLPQATLRIVPNAGHELNKYAPNTIAEILNN